MISGALDSKLLRILELSISRFDFRFSGKTRKMEVTGVTLARA